MRHHRASILLRLLAVFAAAQLIGIGALRAQESSTPHPQLVYAADVARNIKPGQKIAVVITGNDAILSKLLEDAVAIQLANAGFVVYSREEMESALAKLMAVKPDAAATSAVNALDLGKSLGADWIVTGNAVLVLSDLQPVSVKAASLQIISAVTGKPAAQALFDTKDGLRLTEVSRMFLDVLVSANK